MSKKLNPPNYERIEARLWRKNAENVVSNLQNNEQDTLDKIATYAKNFGYNEEIVKKKIKSDPMFAATFSTIPSRQGFHEKEAAKWLTKELKIEVKTLPKSGKNALFVTSDGMITGISPKDYKPSKSLDFFWEYNGKFFYAMHKFTRGPSGGGQGNTYNELKRILQNFQKARNPDNVLIVIADGNFYTEDRMSELRGFARGEHPKSFAVHIENVPSIVKQYK